MLSASPCRKKRMRGDKGKMETAVQKKTKGGFVVQPAGKKKKKKKKCILDQVKR